MDNYEYAMCASEAAEAYIAGKVPRDCDYERMSRAIADPASDTVALYIFLSGVASAVVWFFMAAVLRNQERTREALERLQRKQP